VTGLDRRAFLVSAAALAAAPEALARSLGGAPTALVTADLESHVVAVHMTNGEVLKEIPTRAGPRSIETVGNDALVAHTADGTLSVIDGARLRVRRVLGGFGAPRYTADARDGRHAFVTDSERGELAIVDVDDARVVSRLAVGGPARHVTYHADRREVWTSLGSKAERIAVVDVSRLGRPRLVRRFAPPFLSHDVAFGPGGVVWVSSGATRGLAVYRGPAFFRIAGHAPPQHVTFLNGIAFVTSGDDGTLRVHNARDGRLLRTTRVPTGSYNVQEAFGGFVLMPSLSQGTLCIADRHGRLVRKLRVARSSHDAAFVMSA
jgi:DNA-binding beta-propeller fold protein YncE